MSATYPTSRPTFGGGGPITGRGNHYGQQPQAHDGGLTDAIKHYPGQYDATQDYARMQQAYQQAMQSAQGNWANMLAAQNQYNSLIDPQMGANYYAQLAQQQQQMQGLIDPNAGLLQHQQQMANYAPVQQQSQAFYGYGYS
jgi:hypothetical protein